MFNTRSRMGVANVNGVQKVISQVDTSQAPRSSVASRKRETAYMSGQNSFLGGGGMNGMSVFAGGGSNATRMDLMLTGILPYENEAMMRRFWRDIYQHDAVGGSAADLMSMIPFSDFTLTGAKADELRCYESSVERLNIRSMLSELSLEYLVNGAYVSTLLFDNDIKEFVDQIPHSLDHCTIENMPMYGRDPLITVRPDDEIKRFLNSTDPYMVGIKKTLPPKLVEGFNQGSVILDPLTTVYLPRRTFANSKGSSFFRRLLPMYLLEKILYRGTIVEAAKRQRSMLHLQIGDDNWEPTPDEMNAYVGMFQQADLDPLGAIIGTRAGVQPSELRQGGDFWKYTDVIGETTPVKLRALGISEAFLSGETNLATQETSLTVFLECVKSYREMVTLKFFYNKLFPVISLANKKFKSTISEAERTRLDRQFTANDASKLLIPEVRWHKSLEPKTDRDTLETLSSLEEHGVPVPLRSWCAAGGIELESLLRDLKEDLAYRERIKDITKDVTGNESDADTEAGINDFIQGVTGKLRKVPLLSRTFDPEIRGVSKTGKEKYVPNQRAANDLANAQIAKALSSLSDPHHYADVRNRVSSRLQTSDIYYGNTRGSK